MVYLHLVVVVVSAIYVCIVYVDTRYLVGRFHFNAKINSEILRFKMRLTLCGGVEVRTTDPNERPTQMYMHVTYKILKVIHIYATHSMFAIQNILQKYCSMRFFFQPFLHVLWLNARHSAIMTYDGINSAVWTWTNIY